MGMNIGAKHCEDARYQEALARRDVAILGFHGGISSMAWCWSIRGARRARSSSSRGCGAMPATRVPR
jgi:hypothetical protein